MEPDELSVKFKETRIHEIMKYSKAEPFALDAADAFEDGTTPSDRKALIWVKDQSNE